MESTWTKRARKPVDEDWLQEGLEKLRERIEKRLTRSGYPTDGTLRLVLDEDARGRLFYVNLTLATPEGTIVGTHEDEDDQIAFTRARDHLLRRLERHLARLRGESLRRRRRRLSDELEEALPELSQHRREDRPRRFFQRLLPLLRPLYRTARREIGIRERNGELPRGALTATDLVDDVVLTCYQRFDAFEQAPEKTLFLQQLLRERLDAFVQAGAGPEVSLEAAVSDAAGESEAADAEPPDELTDAREMLAALDQAPVYPEDLVPAEAAPDPEQTAEADELEARAERVVAELPEPDRSAFSLVALEGYEADEAAMVIGIGVEELRSALERAREQVAAAVPATEGALG